MADDQNPPEAAPHPEEAPKEAPKKEHEEFKSLYHLDGQHPKVAEAFEKLFGKRENLTEERYKKSFRKQRSVMLDYWVDHPQEMKTFENALLKKNNEELGLEHIRFYVLHEDPVFFEFFRTTRTEEEEETFTAFMKRHEIQDFPYDVIENKGEWDKLLDNFKKGLAEASKEE